MKFVLNRDKVVVSTAGISIRFAKGVETHVPPHMYEQVMSIGAEPVDGEVKREDEKTDPESKPEPAIGTPERQKALYDAFEKISLKAAREDFDASGAPHVRAIQLAAGFLIQKKERDQAWNAFKQRGGNDD